MPSPSSAFLRFWSEPRARENFLGQTDRQDLLSLRLVCHDAAVRAAPHAFKDIAVSFKSTTFTKPARLAALDRVGQYVRRLTFNLPRGDETFLPPLLEPSTGDEVEFVYTPTCQFPKKRFRKGSNGAEDAAGRELSDLLIKQYPPLYHAAVNVGSFVRAFASLPNLKYLAVSCHDEESTLSTNKTIVDYVLISLRMAIERSNLAKLDHLTLSPISPHSIQHLNPVMGLGARPNSLRRWRQIKNLVIHMPVTSSASQLKVLHKYLATMSPSLKSFTFHWLPAAPKASFRSSAIVVGKQERPSSTGTSYFPPVSGAGAGASILAQRGPNPLTLHMSHLLEPKAPCEKTSSSSLPSLQSMTSASTLNSSSASSSPASAAPAAPLGSSPLRSRPKLRCYPDYQPPLWSPANPDALPSVGCSPVKPPPPDWYPLAGHYCPPPMTPPRRISPASSRSVSPSSASPWSSAQAGASSSSGNSKGNDGGRITTSRTSSSAIWNGLSVLSFPALTFFELDGIACAAAEIAQFIQRHGARLAEFRFEATTLTKGDWDEALAPLTQLSGSDRWRRHARREEEVPLCLGPELSPVRAVAPVHAAGGGGAGAGGGGGPPAPTRHPASAQGHHGSADKSPLLALARGMAATATATTAKPAGRALPPFPATCRTAAAAAAASWDARLRAERLGSGQQALEDGVRKLLAQTVFPWF